MFAKIIIVACIAALARAGLLAEPAIATAYAAPAAYASYPAPAALASYAAPAAYASYAAPAAYASYSAPAYAAHGYGYGSHYDEHAVAHTSENTYRSAGNLHTVSSQSRTIATPYSSSSKQFTKVTNPGIYAHAAPVAIAHHAAYAAPIAHHAAPLAIAAPIAHAGLATTYASHHGNAALGYAAGHSYGHSAHSASLLGTAYSPAIGASHVSYDSPIGIHYGY